MNCQRGVKRGSWLAGHTRIALSGEYPPPYAISWQCAIYLLTTVLWIFFSSFIEQNQKVLLHLPLKNILNSDDFSDLLEPRNNSNDSLFYILIGQSKSLELWPILLANPLHNAQGLPHKHPEVLHYLFLLVYHVYNTFPETKIRTLVIRIHLNGLQLAAK